MSSYVPSYMSFMTFYLLYTTLLWFLETLQSNSAQQAMHHTYALMICYCVAANSRASSCVVHVDSHAKVTYLAVKCWSYDTNDILYGKRLNLLVLL